VASKEKQATMELYDKGLAIASVAPSDLAATTTRQQATPKAERWRVPLQYA